MAASWCLGTPIDPRERRRQCREACRSQRQVWLLQLPAQPLERGDGVVADAVDREQQDVGPADKTREKRRVVLDPAVMMEEARAGALHQRFQLRNLIGPAA